MSAGTLQRFELPKDSPPRNTPAEELPRGGALWRDAETLWTPENTDGLVVCDLAESAVRLTKGQQRGQLVELRHWQGNAICDILRKDSNGKRIYRTYTLWVPRKNSKSLIGSIFALDGLFDEPGAEVYSAAGDKSQAKIVFNEVRAAVEADEELSAAMNCYRDAIEYPELGGVYRALSSDAPLKEGLNPSRVLFDELHVQPDDDLWNVLRQGSGTREQPLVLAISTFGRELQTNGDNTVARRMYDHGKAVAEGEADDPTFGFMSYEAPEGVKSGELDWKDPTIWHFANPGLGDFLHLEDLEAQAASSREADFKTKRLNIWVAGGSVWLPDGTMAQDGMIHTEPPAEGTEIVISIVGTESTDSAGIVGATLPALATHPEDNEQDGEGDAPLLTSEDIGGPAHLFVVDVWERSDIDEETWRVPISEVEASVLRACRRYDVVEISANPSNWKRTIQELEERHGLPVVEYPHTPTRLAPASKLFYDAARDRLITWDGNEALGRHIKGARTKTTQSSGTRLVKDRKTVLATAAVMALDRALIAAADQFAEVNLWL